MAHRVHNGVRRTDLARCTRGKCITHSFARHRRLMATKWNNWQKKVCIHWNFKMQFSQDAYLTVRANIRWTRTFANVVVFFPALLRCCCGCLQFSDHKNFCVSHDIPLARTKFDPAKITRCLKNATDQKKNEMHIRWSLQDNSEEKTTRKRFFFCCASRTRQNHWKKTSLFFAITDGQKIVPKRILHHRASVGNAEREKKCK